MDNGCDNLDLLNERTVFVLDHSAAVLQTTQDQPPSNATPLSKTLWSNMVEAVLEYCRIVFDLFHPEKWISVVTWDTKVNVLTAWLPDDQNFDSKMVAFYRCGRPQESCSFERSLRQHELLPGIAEALELLSMSLHSEDHSSMDSKQTMGRIIYMTTDIGGSFPSVCNRMDEILQENKSLLEEHGRQLKCVEVLFLDLLGSKRATQSPSQTVKESSCGQHSYQYLSSRSGFQFSKQLVRLCESHYRLASSSVLDIPMKEEQQSSSSSGNAANASSQGTMLYGVELLHRIEATSELKRANLLEDLIQREKAPRSGFSQSVRVSWAMPRTTLDISNTPCLSVYRVTPADVSGRASSCLIQFVLGGKSVRLDYKLTRPADPENGQPQEVVLNGEAFILTCHGRELYLHVLRPTPIGATGVQPPWVLLADSAVEKEFPMLPANVVTNQKHISSRYVTLHEAMDNEMIHCPGVIHRGYRTEDFVSLAKKARLVPVSEKAALPCLPWSLAREHLFRETVYWPISEHDSIIYKSDNQCTGIVEAFVKEELDQDDVNTCVNGIRRLKKTQLSLPKQDQEKQSQFLHLCTELDYFLRQHCARSTVHCAIRNVLLKVLCLPANASHANLDSVDQLVTVASINVESEHLLAKETATPGHLASATTFSPWTSTTGGRLHTLDRLLTEGKSGAGSGAGCHLSANMAAAKQTLNPTSSTKPKQYINYTKVSAYSQPGLSLMDIFMQRQQQEMNRKKAKLRRPPLASLQDLKDNRIELYPHLRNAPPAKDVPVG